MSTAKTSSWTEVHIRIHLATRTIIVISRIAIIGEKSNIPNRGIILRMGRSIGSVICSIILVIGLSGDRFNQESNTRPIRAT